MTIHTAIAVGAEIITAGTTREVIPGRMKE
jgi:hypothetical protein